MRLELAVSTDLNDKFKDKKHIKALCFFMLALSACISSVKLHATSSTLCVSLLSNFSYVTCPLFVHEVKKSQNCSSFERILYKFFTS